MELDVLKANKSLVDRVNDLQAQLAKQQQKLDLYMELISNFGHMMPSIIEDFKYEIRKLDAEDTVVGKCEDVLSEEEPTTYANLKKDGISASDDLEVGDE